MKLFLLIIIYKIKNITILLYYSQWGFGIPPPKHNSLKVSDNSSANNIKPSEREIINQIRSI